MKLGDTFAFWFAKPIARGLDGVLGTNIENCGSCFQRQQGLNNFGETIKNWLTNKGDKMDNNNEEIEYLLQISVKAVDLRAATNKITEGKVISGGPMPKMGQLQQPPTRPALAPVQNLPTKP